MATSAASSAIPNPTTSSSCGASVTAARKTWTDEQSHKNFEVVSKLVNPGEPMVSRLTMHPLAPEGGGDVFHSGGRQFMSVKDPDWKTLAAFVNGATLAGRPKKK